jgi:hypothetical protein
MDFIGHLGPWLGDLPQRGKIDRRVNLGGLGQLVAEDLPNLC